MLIFFLLTKSHSSLYNANPADIVEETSAEAHASQGKGDQIKPLALILEPAKDLAEQVCQAIQSYSRYITDPPITSLLLVGGDSTSKQKVTFSLMNSPPTGSPSQRC